MSMRMSVLNLGRHPPARFIDLAQLQEDCGYEALLKTGSNIIP